MLCSCVLSWFYRSLPHSILSDSSEVCLFTKDHCESPEQTESFYRTLLKKHGVNSISRVGIMLLIEMKYDTLLYFFSDLFFSLVFLYGFMSLSLCICTVWIQVYLEAFKFLGAGVASDCELPDGYWEIKPRSFRRATNALKYLAISPARFSLCNIIVVVLVGCILFYWWGRCYSDLWLKSKMYVRFYILIV